MILAELNLNNDLMHYIQLAHKMLHKRMRTRYRLIIGT